MKSRECNEHITEESTYTVAEAFHDPPPKKKNFETYEILRQTPQITPT